MAVSLSMLIQILSLALICITIYLLWKIWTKQPSEEKSLGSIISNLREVSKEMGEIREVGRDIKDFKKDLEKIFASPKARGELGEVLLKDIIAQIVPKEHYEPQYKFKSGMAVDVVIKLEQGIIPIDAKFPLENFRKIIHAESKEEQEDFKKKFVRDVKNHIDDVSSKYIVPKERTFDFALMFIPAEQVYYEIIIQHPDLASYARERKVFIVSPNTIWAYLKAIMKGLEGKRIEEKAEKIMGLIQSIEHEVIGLGEGLDTLNRHINNAKGTMESVNQKFSTLKDDVAKTKMLK